MYRVTVTKSGVLYSYNTIYELSAKIEFTKAIDSNHPCIITEDNNIIASYKCAGMIDMQPKDWPIKEAPKPEKAILVNENDFVVTIEGSFNIARRIITENTTLRIYWLDRNEWVFMGNINSSQKKRMILQAIDHHTAKANYEFNIPFKQD